VQEYTLIKMRALELPGRLGDLASRGGAVFFMAATLRPETMYGQTNCWVLPDGEYGAFQGPGGDVYVMCAPAAARSAKHMCDTGALCDISLNVWTACVPT
jgi:leucyl-tRNA synthetase